MNTATQNRMLSVILKGKGLISDALSVALDENVVNGSVRFPDKFIEELMQKVKEAAEEGIDLSKIYTAAANGSTQNGFISIFSKVIGIVEDVVSVISEVIDEPRKGFPEGYFEKMMEKATELLDGAIGILKPYSSKK
jgi:pyruvate carboxylase